MKRSLHKEKGITLFIAMIITATLLLVSTGVAVIAAREVALSTASRDSQYAFYAADTGADCAIYWDIAGTQESVNWSAFASTSPSGNPAWTAPITCNRDNANFGAVSNNGFNIRHNYSNGFATSTFAIRFLPEPYCAQVTVVKGDDGTTKIESLGFNNSSKGPPPDQASCGNPGGRRVERAVRVTY